MKKFIWSVLALALATCGSVHASDWQLATSSDSNLLYVDFESLVPVGAYRKAWVRIDYFQDKEENDYPKKQYRSVKSLYYFDCTGKRSAVVQRTLYPRVFGEGEVVKSQSVRFNENLLDDVVPDSVGEGLLKVACATPAERAKLKAKNKAADDDLLKVLGVGRPRNEATDADKLRTM